MKRLLHTITLLILQLAALRCGSPGSQSHPATNLEAETKLYSFLDQKDYFRLAAYFQTHQNEISEERKQYFKAFISNAFNQTASSFQYADRLLTQKATSLPHSERVDLLKLQQDNYTKTFQYAKAYEIEDSLLAYYAKWKDTAKTADIKNRQIIDGALARVPAQKVTPFENDTLQWSKDKIGIMEVPIRRRGNTYSFVFDTRASISVITQSFAKQLGLQLLNVSYEESSGITGNKFKSGLGIADSLYLGNTLIEQAVFQVVPDSILRFPQLHFSIQGIIGFPVIKELKSVQFFQNGQLVIAGRTNYKSSLHNFALDGSTTIINLRVEEDTLPFHFDLGANNTILYHTYLEKNRSKILGTALLKTGQFGGAGGTENRQVYVLPHWNVYIGNGKATLDSVDVFTKPIYPGQKFYGNIGQDLVNRFKQMTVHFDSMYIDFR